MTGRMFMPIAPRRSFEDVAEQIKELILSNDLKPGDHLPPERELAEQFHTSRTTVRSALQVLEGLGFVDIRTGVKGGAFVRRLDSRLVTESILYLIKAGQVSFRDFIQARLVIELAALELAMEHITPRQLQEMETLLNKAGKLIERAAPAEPAAIREAMGRFHIVLAAASGNRLYEYLVASMLKLSLQYIQEIVPDLEFEKRHWEQQHRLHRAVIEKDMSLAREALTQNILDVGRLAEQV